MATADNSTPRARAAGHVKDTGAQTVDSAEQTGQQAITSKAFRVLLTVGLVAYGVVHILIGWIALQIAWSGRGEGQEASQKGALAEMAQQPFGAVLGTERSAQLTHVTADGAEWILTIVTRRATALCLDPGTRLRRRISGCQSLRA